MTVVVRHNEGRCGRRRELIPERCGELPTCSLPLLPPSPSLHPPYSSLSKTSPPRQEALDLLFPAPCCGYIVLLCLVPLFLKELIGIK